jgi:hypothetical protein
VLQILNNKDKGVDLKVFKTEEKALLLIEEFNN